MLRRTYLTFLPAVFAAFLLSPVNSYAADEIVVKMATLAPEDSTWWKALRQMGDRWNEISDGKVKVRIYAGGVTGNEGAMVRKMRIGQLHAGALTNLGLMDIDKAPQVTQTPMLIRSYEELDHVMQAIGPDLERRVAERGFVVLTWGDAGWAHLFTKSKISRPEDTGKFKIYAWDGDPEAVEIFRQAGFNPVVLSSTDVLTSLQSGLIDAFPGTPLAALALQWFALAKHMLDVPWAPLVGATVISQEMWDKIPAEYHDPFMTAAREVGESLKGDIRRQDKKAVEVMKKYGLLVTEVDAATQKQWETVALGSHAVVRGKMVPVEIFDRVKKLVEEYRAANP